MTGDNGGGCGSRRLDRQRAGRGGSGWTVETAVSARAVVALLLLSGGRAAVAAETSSATTTIAAAAPSASWNATCPQRCVCHVGWSDAVGDLLHTVSCLDGSLGAPPAELPAGVERFVVVGSALTDLSGLRRSLAASSGLGGRDGRRVIELGLTNCEITLRGLQSLAEAATAAAVASAGGGRGGNLTTPPTSALRALALDGNRLTSLPGGAFGRSLGSLERLSLADNGLTYLDDGALAGLPNLRSLDLHRNRLTSLRAAAWLGGLTRLESFDLSDNHLTTLSAAALAGLRSLRRLSLSGNRLTTLFGGGGGWDEAPPLLSELYAQSNQLRAAPDVSRLALLKILRLDGNPIAELPARAFGAAPSLVELSLAGSPRLEAVHASAFVGCPRLRLLRLNDNPRLAYFDAAALDSLVDLRHLYLHDGALRVLPESLLLRDTAPRRLEELSLYGNPLQCGCHAAWIARSLNASSGAAGGGSGDSSTTVDGGRRSGGFLRFVDGDKMTCGSPRFRAGLTLASLTVADLLASCAPVVFPMFSEPVRAARAGDDVRLACRAVGAARLSWVGCGDGAGECAGDGDVTADGTGNGSTQGAELRLRSVRPSDDGVYTCVASDAENRSDSATVHLQVLRGRLYVGVVSTTSDSVLVRVRAPADRRRGYRYELQCRERLSAAGPAAASGGPMVAALATTGDDDDDEKGGDTVRHYTFHGLRPNSTYDVCLVLYGGGGGGGSGRDQKQRALDERCAGAATQPSRPAAAAAASAGRRRTEPKAAGGGGDAPAELSLSVSSASTGSAAGERLSGATAVACTCLAATLLAAVGVAAFIVRRRALLRRRRCGVRTQAAAAIAAAGTCSLLQRTAAADDRIVLTTADLLASGCYSPTTQPLCASNVALSS